MKKHLGLWLAKICMIGTAAGLVWGLSSLPAEKAGFVAPAAANQTQYVIQSGDSLWAIANRLGTTVEALKQANDLQGDLVYPNQVLVIPGLGNTAPLAAASAPDGETAAAASGAPETEQTKSPAPIEYIVTAGDSLWSIAKKTGCSVAALKQANHVENDFLAIGQVLIIPVPSAAAAPAPVPSRSGDRVQTILDYGRSLLGHPYRWAGSRPGGFDCSGFTFHVFGHHGISLPRTSYDQFTAGTPVSRGELQPGDLVFFTTYQAGASHVGIYYGNGQFLHASSAGGSVIWTDMNAHQYYSSRFLGGRHIIP